MSLVQSGAPRPPMGDHVVGTDEESGMQCPRCGHACAYGARFCDQCGAPLALVCPGCGATNSDNAKFCSNCGTVLPTKASGGSASAKDSTPARDAASAMSSGGAAPLTSRSAYTPPYLVEKILTTRSALEGERKLVTVLFADIADSSAFAQRIDPERLHRLMGEVLQLVAEAVHRYEGTVNQYL